MPRSPYWHGHLPYMKVYFGEWPWEKGEVMAELTEEQLERASSEVVRKHHDPLGTVLTRDVLITAAPFLQMSWPDPTDTELRDAQEILLDLPHLGLNMVNDLRFPFTEFVRRRNAALLPKPVDPRREKILFAIRQRTWPLDLEHELKLVNLILAALDEVKCLCIVGCSINGSCPLHGDKAMRTR